MEYEIPVKVGDFLKLGVIRFGKNGDPIMISKGFIIFLKGIKNKEIPLNEMIDIQIMKVYPKFSFAEMVKNR